MPQVENPLVRNLWFRCISRFEISWNREQHRRSHDTGRWNCLYRSALLTKLRELYFCFTAYFFKCHKRETVIVAPTENKIWDCTHNISKFQKSQINLCAMCVLRFKIRQNSRKCRYKKTPKTQGFEGFCKIRIRFWIISCWTAERDERLWGRTARVLELFFLDILGFSGFLLLSYPVCGP